MERIEKRYIGVWTRSDGSKVYMVDDTGFADKEKWAKKYRRKADCEKALEKKMGWRVSFDVSASVKSEWGIDIPKEIKNGTLGIEEVEVEVHDVKWEGQLLFRSVPQQTNFSVVDRRIFGSKSEAQTWARQKCSIYRMCQPNLYRWWVEIVKD